MKVKDFLKFIEDNQIIEVQTKYVNEDKVFYKNCGYFYKKTINEFLGSTIRQIRSENSKMILFVEI